MTRRIVFHLPTDKELDDLTLGYDSTDVWAVKQYSVRKNGQTVRLRAFTNLVDELVHEDESEFGSDMVKRMLGFNDDELRRRICYLRLCSSSGNHFVSKQDEARYLRELCDGQPRVEIIVECSSNVLQMFVYACRLPPLTPLEAQSLLNLSFLCDLALALLQKDVAPYVVLDIFNMLIDTSTSNFEIEANRHHYKKIKMVEEVQRRLRLRSKTN